MTLRSASPLVGRCTHSAVAIGPCMSRCLPRGLPAISIGRRAPSCRQRHICKCSSSDDSSSNNNVARGRPRAAPDAATRQQLERDNTIILAIGTSLFVAVAATFTLFQEDLQDLLFYGSLSIGTASLGVGDIAGALLWSTALWFVSPLQLLLLFLGRIETERPSDWLLQVLGRAAGMQYVPQRCTLPCSSHSITYRQDDPEYEAPLPLRAAVGGITLATGTALAVLLSGGLGDATWSVSTGLGACMAAGMYEVGRPTRMSKEQAVALELQWQDFASFAEQQLQRSGRCHETEVFRVFRRALPKYRDIEVLDDAVLRQMIKNWHPGVERTALGYYKGLSLSPPREA